MNHETHYVEVRYDFDTDPEMPVWCVMLCLADGEEIRCLDTWVIDDEANYSAVQHGKRLGLEVHVRAENGRLDRIA